MNVLTFLEKTIRYSFYILIIATPLFFTNSTSELFELNKMWIVWGLTLIITLAWGSGMILQKQFKVTRTVFDLPILLFLLSQVISTLISIDPRTSLWGYYSRFNGGLFSIFAYIVLYYAFVTHFTREQVIRFLQIGLIACALVLIWGIPSHFGKDPTCYIFRGTFDVSCWTESFKPTIRIFSTLGQPAWMAAYVNIFIFLSLSFTLFSLDRKKMNQWVYGYAAIAIFSYIALLFTSTRAGFLAFVAGNIVFWGVLFLKKVLKDPIIWKTCIGFHIAIILFTFLIGTPIGQINFLTLPGLQAKFTATPTPQIATPQASQSAQLTTSEPVGGTDSSVIRLYVWKGAIDIWKANPLFGTGVETFAFAYYKHKPIDHNKTSEWDFLYNKAHNEYLNYLATTGIVGLGTYLALITTVLIVAAKKLFMKKETHTNVLLVTGLLSAYITILITNFFGFSVVIINLLFFLIPAMLLLLSSEYPLPSFSYPAHVTKPNSTRWVSITVLGILVIWLLISLLRFWSADKKYAYAHNLAQTGQVEYMQQSYPLLQEAYTLWPSEPTIVDELAQQSATIATALYSQNNATDAAQFKDQAISLSEQVTNEHPANVVFWKNRVRILYTLSQIDQQYLPQAITAIQTAYTLAPTDTKIMYNLGVLYGQTERVDEGIALLEEAKTYRPTYRDVYYALGLFYRQKATNNTEKVIYPEFQKKAVENISFILTNLSADDIQAQQLLTLWGESMPNQEQ